MATTPEPANEADEVQADELHEAKTAKPKPRAKATSARVTPAQATGTRTMPASSTPATKKAAPRKATKATKATKIANTEKQMEAEPVSPKDERDIEVPAPWWAGTPMSIGAVPELLAEAAVERFGDSADRYLRWLRATYPEATPDGLTRLVALRLAKSLPFVLYAGPLALLTARAQLVLHIAGAYGRDPRDRQRVPELVALIDPKSLTAPVLGRFAGRLLPGAGLVVSAFTYTEALEATARRATAYYRQSAYHPQR